MEIKFNNVSYTYNPNSPIKKKALSNIDLAIKEKQINGIIGRSGSGKTTLVELLNALLIPTSGNIKVDEFIIQKDKKIVNVNNLRVNIGLVFQFPEEQFFNLKVKDEIKFGMKYFDIKADEIDNRCIEALNMVGLDDSYLNRDTFKLSSGEMRKVAIASVLAFNPKVVILDEPTIGLDSSSKKNLINLIRLLKVKYDKTIIVITHDVDLLHQISDYIFVLDNGKLVLEGDKYQVFTSEELLNYGLIPPKIIEFEKLVLENKNIKIGYRDDINDLIKDIYRYAK
ncbi:MAG: ATP-binding cassette domain-containing protein [Firmicutes bacterium]|nr:ATP-binding cassette domain-containing protein [Bacillota bacterium]